jgi:hypothetical protein
MWRAFFFAVGYLLMFLGLQSLVFERVQLSQEAKVPPFIRRMLHDPAAPSQPSVYSRQAPAVASRPVIDLRSRALGGGTGLGYGPSRFTNGGFGGGSFSAAPYRNHVDSRPTTFSVSSGQPGGVPRVDLAGYRSPVSQPATTGTGEYKLPKVIQAQDWMPWSLLAGGFVIVLYTQSFGSRTYTAD